MQTTLTSDQERRRVRKALRRLRRELEPAHRTAGERAIAARITRLGAFRRARAIAVYYAFDGEPSVARVARAAARLGKRVYAPIVRDEHMLFAPVHIDARNLSRNLFGIEEPSPGAYIDGRHLDLVLTPMVAFDGRGVRMGMGRGYYDRAFQFLRTRSQWLRPKLVGVAWSFQQVDELLQQPWDVPLWGAITEAAELRFTAGTE